jgi:signal peptidase I
MEDTMLAGDRLVADMWYFRSREPARGELVVFRYPPDPNRDFIKRCIAIPGDTVEIRNKQLFLNGTETKEDYAVFRNAKTYESTSPGPRGLMARNNFGPLTVPPESIFVLGDNRDNSSDSRFWGVVPFELLRGKALYLYWGESVERIGIALE